MLSRTVLAIGLLLCGTHFANTYILFSANIEDIRKVASKFLSNDIVEQITKLISKVKSDGKLNLSEENKKNEKTINKISDDELEESPIRSKSMKKVPIDEMEKAPRHAEPMNKISEEIEARPARYQIEASINEISKETEEKASRYKTTRGVERERATTNSYRQYKKDKDRERDLYWNDNDGAERGERLIATSGRIRLPELERTSNYNWDNSSDD